MTRFIIAALLAAQSIGAVGKPLKKRAYFTESDKYFEPFYKDFEERFDVPITNIPIKFVGIKGGQIALCYYNASVNIKFIVVDRFNWNKLSRAGKQFVIDHELGHCHFKYMKHDNGRLLNGRPRSIMSSAIFSGLDLRYYNQNDKYYVNELKRKAANAKK